MASTDQLTTASDQSARAARAAPGRSWLPLLAVSLGFFMVILDVTVVTVAVPVLGGALHTSASALQWVVDGYTLVFACLLLLCGAMGDRFGHRRAFLAGLAVFTVASAACGAATTGGQLIMARLLQGAGAALMVPASLALLRAAYPEPAARARAFGVWGAVSGLGAAAGPVIGGLAVWAISWRAVFLVNLPFGVLATALTVRCVPAPRPHRGARLRLPAQLLGVAALAALTTALNEGGTRGWTDPLIVGCLGGAVAAGAACAVLLRRPVDAAVRSSRAQRRGLAGGATVGLLLNLGFYGLLFLATLYFQQQRGYGPLTAGLALLPMFVVMTVSSFASGRLGARTGPRAPMVVGLLAGAVGLAGWLLAAPDTPYPVLVAPMALAGLGTSFAMPAATTAVMESAPSERGGTAAALLNAARQLGSALGVALFGSLSAAHLIPGIHLSALLAATGFVLAAATAAVTAPGRRA
ncbi:MFS transporter [Streptomyces silvisoli]|uniref:MFS transporter n=1 Tax=Streptomyces silvisoli TaxID=3034235 RepID=A0ABT5ZQI5_9ACTN|nr:MFS transporter [Streptomyces silvisoli]MDF3291865.1 MFS transporter [Streptomyces silvisoli]